MNKRTGLNVLITGASSGFGRRAGETLTRSGYRVFATMRGVNGKNAGAAEELLEWGKRERGSLHVIEMDVQNEDSVQKAVHSITGSGYPIDVVVNNAGIGVGGLLESTTMYQVKEIFDVNVFGAHRVNRGVLPEMRRRKSGLIIHITSPAGRICFPFMGIYSASKFALEALAESYHFELAPFGIDSVIIETGAYPTGIQNKAAFSFDSERTAEYGEVAGVAEELLAGLRKFADHANGPDPQEVADAIKRLIETPAGERPLRTVVGRLTTQGVEVLNQAAEKSHRQCWEASGWNNLLSKVRL